MKETRYQQVADKILNLINNGVLKEGDKIPSIRQLSNELDVSINTVKEAYWKLESRNYIAAVPQSGFYVSRRLKEVGEFHPVDPLHLNPQEVSLCRIYGEFQKTGECESGIGLGIASSSSGLWPTKKISRFLQEAVRDREYESYNYMMPPGFSQLREQIARQGLSSGLDLSPEEIIITNGCHEAIFLALMALCRPGDSVALESPIYFNLLHLIEQLHLKVIEIPTSGDDGINLDTLRFVLDNHPVKAVFSISNFNNPLGFVIPSEKKKKLVELLAGYDVPLIEDDIYGDLSFRDRPDTCKSFDTTGNVFLCSSFSKTVAPGLRIGWIAPPGKHFDGILKLKTLLNISTASINQIAVSNFLKMGGYERHLRNLRKNLEKNVAALRAAVLRYFPKGTRASCPEGGMLVWVELPESLDTMDIYQTALAKSIMIAPGFLFTMKGKYTNCMRLNAGIWNVETEKAVEILGELCEAYLNPDCRLETSAAV